MILFIVETKDLFVLECHVPFDVSLDLGQIVVLDLDKELGFTDPAAISNLVRARILERLERAALADEFAAELASDALLNGAYIAATARH